MKKLFNTAIVLGFILHFVGCEMHNMPPGMNDPYSEVYVVKYKQAGYSDYILTDIYDHASCVLGNYLFHDTLIGTNPMIKISDDYYFTNTDFVKTTAGPEYLASRYNALVNVKWEDWDGERYSWPLDNVIEYMPFAETYRVSIKQKYKEYNSRVKKKNPSISLNDYIKDWLVDVIEDGKLHKVAKVTYEPNPYIYPDERSFWLFKFKEEEYKNHVMAIYKSQLNQWRINIGKLPEWGYEAAQYIDYGDGYCMVNWMWEPLFLADAMSNHAVLKFKWEDFKTSKQYYGLAEDVYDAKPLKECWGVSEASFISYQSKEMGREDDEVIIPYTVMSSHTQYRAHYDNHRSFMDSLYREYTTIFQHMVSNNKLSQYGERFEPYK